MHCTDSGSKYEIRLHFTIVIHEDQFFDSVPNLNATKSYQHDAAFRGSFSPDRPKEHFDYWGTEYAI